jgi:hypothetical protein
MSIVGAFDVHRRQLTFDCVDTGTGLCRRGRVLPADRQWLRTWLAQFSGAEGEFALEGCTDWRYVVEEISRAGLTPRLAEPADAAALRGKKRHAKTDKTDAARVRAHLMSGDRRALLLTPTRRAQNRLPPRQANQRRRPPARLLDGPGGLQIRHRGRCRGRFWSA